MREEEDTKKKQASGRTKDSRAQRWPEEEMKEIDSKGRETRGLGEDGDIREPISVHTALWGGAPGHRPGQTSHLAIQDEHVCVCSSACVQLPEINTS